VGSIIFILGNDGGIFRWDGILRKIPVGIGGGVEGVVVGALLSFYKNTSLKIREQSREQ